MDADEFGRQLRTLGLHGPMGEMLLETGEFVLVYKMPDGRHKHPPTSSLTGTQRTRILEVLYKNVKDDSADEID